MQWKFHDRLDGLMQEEIEGLSFNDTKKRGELACNGRKYGDCCQKCA